MRVRPVKIDTYKENVVFLRKDCPLCRAQGFAALSKVEVRCNGRSVIGVLNVIDESFLAKGEVGLCEYAFRNLGARPGAEVEVHHLDPVRSVEHVRAKIHGEMLGQEDYREILGDIVANRYSKVELTAFVIGCAQGFMDRQEIYYLSQAMVEQGQRIDWGREMVVDKHCIGGIPGNRTTMVVVPIVAAYGLTIPKTSSRSITSPAGTADTMEVLANVDMSLEQMRAVVEKESGCLAWGGSLALSPADDIIISVERPLNIDAVGQMIASILSKKKAAGSTHVLIDIPVGPTAKVTTMSRAVNLKKLFEYVGEKMGMAIEVLVTDGSQPIGRGIGPVLEVQDVMAVLSGSPDAPADLREKCIKLAGRILDFDPRLRGGEGRKVAEQVLASGQALEKMKAIVAMQGAKPPKAPGSVVKEALASATGKITALNNQQLASCAKLAGAPIDQGAGLYLLKKVGESVMAGEPLFRIHAEEDADMGYAWDYWKTHQEMVTIE
ncbi:MAG: thymidine phosphorylase family protein [Acidobacteria bacterium]|nr:thymidine phosphorylase family protein [Acidobacteriota bacterium]